MTKSVTVRILLVEDEPLVRELAFEDLCDEGFEVELAGTGEEALQILARDPDFQVLFTDIRMPGSVDGWQLGRAALSDHPAMKVIYATGYSESMHELGDGEMFIRKPYRREQIFDAIRRLCQ